MQILDQSRIVVEGGYAVTIDGSTISRAGSKVLVLGTPTLIWRPGKTPDSTRVSVDSALGIERDEAGHVTVVPLPLTERVPLYPRAREVTPGTWDVLFVTGHEGARGNPLVFDTATIWHGRFDGKWHDVERVALVKSAILRHGLSSDLVRTREGLSFAYAFDEPRPAGDSLGDRHGVVMIKQRFERWDFDTLATWETPQNVQLSISPGGGVLVALAQAYWDDRVAKPPALFIAQYDSAWHRPQLFVGDASVSIGAPSIVSDSRRLLAAWQSHDRNTDRFRVESAGLTLSDLRARPIHISDGRGFDRFAVTAIDTGRTMWIVRDRESRRFMRSFLQTGQKVTDLGRFGVPFDNFYPLAVSLGNSSLLLVTGRLNAPSAMPPAASYLTELRLSCRDEGR